MKSKILGLLAVALLAGPVTAQAIVITIDGQGSADGQWEVTTATGTFNALAPSLTQEVWWGNQDLAYAFAATLNNQLGLPNFGGRFGPFFAFEIYVYMVRVEACCIPEGINEYLWPPLAIATYAKASRVSVPEPGTLALFGLGLAGLGVSRRRKA